MATKTDARLEIPAIRIGKMQLTIHGDSQLVCHSFDEKAKRQILDKQTGKASAGRQKKDPTDDFMRAFYIKPGTTAVLHDQDPANVFAVGEFCFPAIGLKSAAVRAATDAGMRMTDMRRAFHIPAELVVIKSQTQPVMRMDMVRVGLGGADVRFRPEFRDWSIDVPIHFNEAVISVEQVVNLFNLAGFGVGIGEWRPEKSGQWGRFHVEGDVQIR